MVVCNEDSIDKEGSYVGGVRSPDFSNVPVLGSVRHV